jgi:hypothetical protein
MVINLRTKKVLAREFLAIVGVLIIGTVSFLVTFVYNFYENSIATSIVKEVEAKRALGDSLTKVYKEKTNAQLSYTNSYHFEYSSSYASSNEKVWQYLYQVAKSDSINFYWDYGWEKKFIDFNIRQGLKNASEFKSFIINTMIYKLNVDDYQEGEQQYQDALLLEPKRTIALEKMLGLTDQLNTAGVGMLFGLAFLFLLRYLIYGVKWSLHILKI